MERQPIRQIIETVEPNPYQAPQSVAGQSTGIPTMRKWRLYVAWFFIFLLNLIVPISFGWQVTEIAGESGMLLATLILLAVGFLICSNARRVGFALVSGGVATALSQVFPVLQLVAGIAGLGVANALGLMAKPRPNVSTIPVAASEVGGFVVTLVTGALLMAAATGVGFTFMAFFHRRAPGGSSE